MFRFLLTKLFAKREKMQNEDVKPFLDHLEDLRGTLFKMAAALVTATLACGYWYQDIFKLLEWPLRLAGYDPHKVLFFGEFTGGFMIAITVSFYAGIVVSLPILMYFLGGFVMPAMTDKEKRYVVPALFAGFVLFLAGAAFCFSFIMPLATKFMVGFNSKLGAQEIVEAKSYFKTVALMAIVFGLLCQLPVVMITLHGIGIVSYQWIRSTRMYAYAGILTLCGVVSPTGDIPSLFMFSLPIMALHEACIWIIYFLEKRQKPPESTTVVSVAVAAAAMPYGDVRSDHDSGHHSDPHHYDEPSHLSDDPSHYNDGHYHDDHYHREHPELHDEAKPEPEPKADPEKAVEPEKHADATSAPDANPKAEDKQPENKEPGT